MNRFPLIPIRRDMTGGWDLLEITEDVTVPYDNDQTIRLGEVPDNGEIRVAPTIPGLSRTIVYPPNPFQFYVNYRTGDIQFNANQAGQTFPVTYWGKGSLIEADDLNFLNDTIVAHLTNHIHIDDYSVSSTDAWSAQQIINYVRNNSEIFQTDTYTLTATDITRRFVLLSQYPKYYNKVILLVGNGVVCNIDEDFTVDSLNTKLLRWDGFELEGLLAENDVLYAIYAR